MIWSETEGGQSRVTVTVPCQQDLLIDLRQRLSAGSGFSVATLNLDHVVKLARDRSFQAAYAAHTHVTADGNPIVWLSRLAGQKDIDLVPGSELVEPVVALAAELDVPVALFGSTEATLAATKQALESRYRGLDVSLVLSPPMGFDPHGAEADMAIRRLCDSKARVVFLALGAPKQEIFAARAQAELPHVGFLSVGAGLDFIAGAQKRAPRWVRAVAAEWLWRLAGNPRRLMHRYGLCLVALPGLLRKALRTRITST